jgi:hypothetical protein
MEQQNALKVIIMLPESNAPIPLLKLNNLERVERLFPEHYRGRSGDI